MGLKELIFKRSISDENIRKIATTLSPYQFFSKRVGSISITAANIISRFVLSADLETEVSGDWYNIIKLMVEGEVLYGVGYAEFDGDFVYPLPPLLQKKDGYYSLGERSIDADKVIEMKTYEYNYNYQGLLNYLSDELKIDAKVFDVVEQYFDDYTYPTTIGVVDASSEEQLNKIKGIWMERYQNKANSIFLVNYPIEIHHIIRQLDTEAISYAYTYVLERVASYTGIPINLLKGEKITAEEERIFMQTVIIPLQKKIEQAFATREITVKFNRIASGIGMLSEVSNAVKLGIISINEAREIFGLDPVEGGDDLFILNPEGIEKVKKND